jgi:hypothetical protein
MAQRKARFYQRLRTSGFPWVLCETAKNGSPKPRPDVFQFGVRYSLNGKHGVEMPDAAGKEATPRTTRRNGTCCYFDPSKIWT